MSSPFETGRAANSESLLRWSNSTAFFVSLLAYVLLAQCAQTLLYSSMIDGTTFWPGAGLILALLLMLPTRQWLWVIAAVALGEFGRISLQGFPTNGNVFSALSNCIEPLLGAALLRRGVNTAGSFTPLPNLMRLLGYGVITAPMLGATIGAIGTLYSVGTPFWHSWPKYFVADALGVLVMAPFLLARVRPSNPLRWSREQVIFIGLLALTSLLTLLNRSASFEALTPFLLPPFMLWAALRLGIQCTASSNLYIAWSAIIASSLGFIPSQADVLPDIQGVTVMQVRLLITTTTALMVAVLTHDLIQGLGNEKRLMKQAHRDELTGLYNRAGLHFRLSNAMLQHRIGKPMHLLICDLDAFKPVNDQYGHPAGDQVLIEVAKRLHASIRDGDVVARIGGDEFVVMLDNSDSESVSLIAHRIIEKISRPVTGSFGEVHISMSIGITSWEAGADIESAMHVADQALYKAKHLGKNRCVWANA